MSFNNKQIKEMNEVVEAQMQKIYDKIGMIKFTDELDKLPISDFELLFSHQRYTYFTVSGDTYVFKMTGANKEQLEAYSQYIESGLDVKVEFYIELPNKAISHNATTVSKDGKTYTWNLLDVDSIEIEFTLPENGGYSPIPVIIGIIAVCVIVGLIASRSNKKEEPKEE